MKHSGKFVIAAIALLAIACKESDEAAITRLRAEQAIAEQDVHLWEGKVLPRVTEPDSPTLDVLLDSANAAHLRLDLANRNLNRFMSGGRTASTLP